MENEKRMFLRATHQGPLLILYTYAIEVDEPIAPKHTRAFAYLDALAAARKQLRSERIIAMSFSRSDIMIIQEPLMNALICGEYSPTVH
jgi:hypothetical protein